MAKKLVISKRELKIKLLIIAILAICLAVSVIFSKPIEKLLGIGITHKSGKYVSSEIVETGDMVVHYIDVGQADCTYIKLPDGTDMLIDSGDKETAQQVSDYLKAVNSDNIINHFVLTHSDSDHIGGAPQVLKDFEVQNIYRPFALLGEENSPDSYEAFVTDSTDELAPLYNKLRTETMDNKATKSLISSLPRVTTTIYRETISAIYSETFDDSVNNVNVFVNYQGITISTTDSLKPYQIKFYAPLKSELNIELSSDYTGKTKGYLTKGYGTGDDGTSKNAISPLIKVEYLGNKFVFTGDMYEIAEKDVVNSLTPQEKAELSNITVYQAGHHGASNSNTVELLNIFKPKYTVVSCGLNNKYKHPTETFLNRIKDLDHDITDYLLRTDKQGTIAFAVFENGDIKYSANVELTNTVFEVAWWQIAVGIFIVGSIIIVSVRFRNKRPKQTKR